MRGKNSWAVWEFFLGRRFDLIVFFTGQYVLLTEEEGLQLEDPVPIRGIYIAE
jgi:hypothetical protein